ncbi:nociceptin receptor-like [Watersipora subatra]|uniref:nociceptin receptor-like n=1 Tax=Watersipora subatra TaxID=2589382 RepID=UPI00355AE985
MFNTNFILFKPVLNSVLPSAEPTPVMMNSSNSTFLCDTHLSGLSTSLCTTGFVINILHLIGLQVTSKSEKISYNYILIGITSTDALHGFTYGVCTSCSFKDFLWTYDSGFLNALVAVATTGTIGIRYFLLMLASLDRFYAIRRPHDYKSSRITSNIGKLSLTGIILILVINVGFASFPDFVSFDEVFGCTINFSENPYMTLVGILQFVIPVSLNAVLLAMVIKKLLKMNRQPAGNGVSRDIKIATKYILGTCLMFYIALTPVLVYSTAIVTLKDKDLIRAFEWTTLFSQVVYGTANVLFYCYIYRKYLPEVKNWTVTKVRGATVNPN